MEVIPMKRAFSRNTKDSINYTLRKRMQSDIIFSDKADDEQIKAISQLLEPYISRNISKHKMGRDKI